MTAEDFSKWCTDIGWPDTRIAQTLGLSRNTPRLYREKGAPRYIGYACAAISAGLTPYGGPSK